MSKYHEALETLNNLVSEFDMLLDINKQFEKENIKLEKALDKACSKLAIDLDCTLCEQCCALRNKFDCTNEKEWKEFLLKESEKQ